MTPMTDDGHHSITLARNALTEALGTLGLAAIDAIMPLPLPPDALVAAVNAPAKRDEDVFLASGMEDLASLLRALHAAGWRPSAPPAVLDFGSGAGRLLRHVLPWASRLAAVDRQPEHLEWLATCAPGVETALVTPKPCALPWPAATFDLVLANSVFTHVPLAWHAGWLAELQRVLCPRGAVALTMLGDTHRLALLDDGQRTVLDEGGSLEVWPEHDSTGEVVAYGAVFERADLCAARLGRHLPVSLRVSQDGRQDVVVLLNPGRTLMLRDDVS